MLDTLSSIRAARACFPGRTRLTRDNVVGNAILVPQILFHPPNLHIVHAPQDITSRPRPRRRSPKAPVPKPHRHPTRTNPARRSQRINASTMTKQKQPRRLRFTQKPFPRSPSRPHDEADRLHDTVHGDVPTGYSAMWRGGIVAESAVRGRGCFARKKQIGLINDSRWGLV